MKISGENRAPEYKLDEVYVQSTKHYYHATDQINSTRVVLDITEVKKGR